MPEKFFSCKTTEGIFLSSPFLFLTATPWHRPKNDIFNPDGDVALLKVLAAISHFKLRFLIVKIKFYEAAP